MNILRWTTTIGRVLRRFLGWLVGQGRKVPAGPSRGPGGFQIAPQPPQARTARASPPGKDRFALGPWKSAPQRRVVRRQLVGIFDLTGFLGLDAPDVFPHGTTIDQPVVVPIQPAPSKIPEQFSHPPRIESPESHAIELAIPGVQPTKNLVIEIASPSVEPPENFPIEITSPSVGPPGKFLIEIASPRVGPFSYPPEIGPPESYKIEITLPSEPIVFGQVRLRRRDALRLKGRARRLGQQPRPTPTADDELWQQVWAILSLPPRIDELVQIRYPHQLRAYQVEGVKLLIEKERFLLADEMGTGKTVQACVALSLLIPLGRVDRALVLCPKTVVPVWLQHLVIWVPEATCHNHEHLPARFPRDRARVWILPYSRVRVANALARWGNDWDVVIWDEIHELRNPLTRGYQAISQMIAYARYRWGLSGTPLQNRLEDLSAIYGIIRPELNLRAEFLGAAAIREAIRPYLRRISRESALADLPQKNAKRFGSALTPHSGKHINRSRGYVMRRRPVAT